MIRSASSDRGCGLHLRYAVHQTPFGACWMVVAPAGIHRLEFVPDSGAQDLLAALQRRWPDASLSADAQAGGHALAAFLAGDHRCRQLDFWVDGTAFQRRVWGELLDIEHGGLRSYRQLAAAIGQPGAARAVGNAVGANPVSLLIPCHRVVKNDGEWGNYRGGRERKAQLLRWELDSCAVREIS